MRPPASWLRALAGLALAAAGCDPYTFTTEVVVRDPGKVSVRRSSGAYDIVLAEGREPRTAVVAEGAVPTGPRASAPYSLSASRGPGGGVDLDLTTQLPVLNGTRFAVLGSDGSFEPLPIGVEKALPPGFLLDPELAVPVCGHLTRVRYGYEASWGELPCASGLTVYLATPWDNVTLLRQSKVVTSDRRAGSIVGFVAVVVPLAIAGGYLVGHSPDSRAAGVGFLAAATVVALPLVPGIFAPSRVDVLYPPPAAR